MWRYGFEATPKGVWLLKAKVRKGHVSPLLSRLALICKTTGMCLAHSKLGRHCCPSQLHCKGHISKGSVRREGHPAWVEINMPTCEETTLCTSHPGPGRRCSTTPAIRCGRSSSASPCGQTTPSSSWCWTGSRGPLPAGAPPAPACWSREGLHASRTIHRQSNLSREQTQVKETLLERCPGWAPYGRDAVLCSAHVKGKQLLLRMPQPGGTLRAPFLPPGPQGSMVFSVLCT